ncbi:MAG: alpha/beta fold hydrolase [Candidatus Kariarchaeaceae archaeon]|jgi:pimeloyl-ACP methyl ester carboxylesterase
MKFESIELNSETRENAPGNFVELSQGFVHYELLGPEDGDLVVLIHGFSVPSFFWDKNVEFLRNAGYRTLRYDLYGRGYSDRPKVKYDENLFLDQLYELLEKLDLLENKSNLIGLSMGGAISTLFSVKYPNLVKNTILLAPAGLPMPVPVSALLLKIPILNSLLFRMFGTRTLIEGLSHDYQNQPDNFPEIQEKYIQQMQYKGFRSAILSTINNFPLTSLTDKYKQLGQLKIPVLLIGGTEDSIIPFNNYQQISEIIPHADFHVLENTGHAVQVEQIDKVNDIILGFLEKQP